MVLEAGARGLHCLISAYKHSFICEAPEVAFIPDAKCVLFGVRVGLHIAPTVSLYIKGYFWGKPMVKSCWVSYVCNKLRILNISAWSLCRSGCLSLNGASSTPRPQREDAPNWAASWTLVRGSLRGRGDARRVQVRQETIYGFIALGETSSRAVHILIMSNFRNLTDIRSLPSRYCSGVFDLKKRKNRIWVKKNKFPQWCQGSELIFWVGWL